VKKSDWIDWLLRFVKGVFIGTGFVLPGVSGGALAAVFGIYERIISFLAHITRDFWKNVVFFLPVGFGGLFGIFLVSFPVSFFMDAYEVQVLWFFVGCILGTLPALWKQAGKHGRKNSYVVIMAVSAVFGYIFLRFSESAFGGQVPLNFATWMAAGAIIGFGVLVPGLSPSNFLVYFNLYKPMVDSFKSLDVMTVLPIALGGLICLLVFSKLMDYLFSRFYTGLFHFILGIVLASTVMIVPTDFNYLSAGTLVCVLTCILGIALGWWMSGLEDKYKLEH
jgi:putative membrane protein